MTEPEDRDALPPEPSANVERVGQSKETGIATIHSGVPMDSRIAELPAIILDGARETVHSELTWKLISKIVSQGEEERDSLRAERDSARIDAEKWRARSEAVSHELVGLRARWESISTLTNAQSLLYVAGGASVGPALQDILAGKWAPETLIVAALGVAVIWAGHRLGKIGPRRIS